MDRCLRHASFSPLVVAWLALAGLVLGASGCSTPEPVQLTVSAERRDDRLMIEGRANVPDGAWLVYAAYPEAAASQHLKGAARVRNGVYQAERGVAGWPAEPIVVDVHFQIRSEGLLQPAWVRERYGPRGESMTGPGVIAAGEGSRVAIAKTTVNGP